jgi:hypothetical protein
LKIFFKESFETSFCLLFFVDIAWWDTVFWDSYLKGTSLWYSSFILIETGDFWQLLSEGGTNLSESSGSWSREDS